MKIININHYRTLEAAQNHLSFCSGLVNFLKEKVRYAKIKHGKNSTEYHNRLSAYKETQQMIKELEILIEYFDFK